MRREKDEEREADKEEGKEKKNRDEKQKPLSKICVWSVLSRPHYREEKWPEGGIGSWETAPCGN